MSGIETAAGNSAAASAGEQGAGAGFDAAHAPHHSGPIKHWFAQVRYACSNICFSLRQS